jgi:hypothetical protein
LDSFIQINRIGTKERHIKTQTAAPNKTLLACLGGTIATSIMDRSAAPAPHWTVLANFCQSSIALSESDSTMPNKKASIILRCSMPKI